MILVGFNPRFTKVFFGSKVTKARPYSFRLISEESWKKRLHTSHATAALKEKDQ
jgi:hypothetical protein